MNAQSDSTTTFVDKLMLVIAAAIVVAGVWAYYEFEDQTLLLRTGGVLGSIIVGLLVAAATNPGRRLWRFSQTSRVELKKVVWPTRQEAMQTTIYVIIFALIMGVFFWLLDMGLTRLARFLTGQG